jgi:ABC-type oligopeptide transport system substrate-binding subunit
MAATVTQATPQQLPGEIAAGRFDVLLGQNVHGANATNCDADTVPWWSRGSALNDAGLDDERAQALLQQARAAATPTEADVACLALNQLMTSRVFMYPMWYLSWAVVARDEIELTLAVLPDGSKPQFGSGRIPVLGLTRKS